jgi:hypothetical protein
MTLGIAAVAALTAAAPFIATHTGQWNRPEEVSVGGPGENYRLNGSDFAQSLAALSSDIPFPDEVSRATVQANMVAQAKRDKDTQESTGALRADLARGAICAWERTWQAANNAGDQSRRRAATEALSGALTWSAVTDVDPHPSIDGYAGDNGPAPTVFGDLPGMVEAAQQGRAKALADRLKNASSGYCVYLDDRPAPESAAPAPSGPVSEAVATTPPSAPETKK